MDIEIIRKRDGCIVIKETKDVETQSFAPGQIENEILSIQSELDNFELIQQNRRNYLETRLAELEAILDGAEAE